jgi:hypothetical protein
MLKATTALLQEYSNVKEQTTDNTKNSATSKIRTQNQKNKNIF